MTKYLVTKVEKCEHCNGRGLAPTYPGQGNFVCKCKHCKGKKEIRTETDLIEALRKCGISQISVNLFGEIKNDKIS